MRQKAKVVLLFLFLLLQLLFDAQAAELAPQGTRARKFQRGLLNVVFAPIELSKTLDSEKTKDNWVPSWGHGLLVGLINTGIRAMTGAYEILTTPIPSPPRYAPLYHPEFSLEHLGVLKQDVSSSKDNS